MSRLEEVRAEYERLRPSGPVARGVRRAAFIRAQYSVRLRRTNGTSRHDACGSYHSRCRAHASAKDVIDKGYGCWCDSPEVHLAALSYDDWGDGPQCVMCGAPKNEH